jgi:hypothetical protein
MKECAKCGIYLELRTQFGTSIKISHRCPPLLAPSRRCDSSKGRGLGLYRFSLQNAHILTVAAHARQQNKHTNEKTTERTEDGGHRDDNSVLSVYSVVDYPNFDLFIKNKRRY